MWPFNSLLLLWTSFEAKVQFHHHFMHAFFIQKQILQLFSNYRLALSLFSKRILAKNSRIKCWWNFTNMLTLRFYSCRFQKRKKHWWLDYLFALLRYVRIYKTWWNRPPALCFEFDMPDLLQRWHHRRKSDMDSEVNNYNRKFSNLVHVGKGTYNSTTTITKAFTRWANSFQHSFDSISLRTLKLLTAGGILKTEYVQKNKGW